MNWLEQLSDHLINLTYPNMLSVTSASKKSDFLCSSHGWLHLNKQVLPNFGLIAAARIIGFSIVSTGNCISLRGEALIQNRVIEEYVRQCSHFRVAHY